MQPGVKSVARKVVVSKAIAGTELELQLRLCLPLLPHLWLGIRAGLEQRRHIGRAGTVKGSSSLTIPFWRDPSGAGGSLAGKLLIGPPGRGYATQSPQRCPADSCTSGTPTPHTVPSGVGLWLRACGFH